MRGLGPGVEGQAVASKWQPRGWAAAAEVSQSPCWLSLVLSQLQAGALLLPPPCFSGTHW